jgi:hypothetical protein
MKPIALAILLSCLLLAACDHVDPMIAQKGAQVLNRDLPADFQRLVISWDDFGRSEKCETAVRPDAYKNWDLGTGTLIVRAEIATDSNGSAMELHAHRTDEGWVIADSDVTPNSVDMAEFEKRVQACVDAFRTWHQQEVTAKAAEAAKAAQNALSWQASDAHAIHPASAPTTN